MGRLWRAIRSERSGATRTGAVGRRAHTAGTSDDDTAPIWLETVASLTPDQRILANAMSDVSESAYCAGWMHGTEYGVWRLLHDGGTWGMLSADDLAEPLAAVRAALAVADCWIVWDDDADEQEAVPLDEWRQRYEAWEGRR